MPLLPNECPNCGRRHEGHDFFGDPGPVQTHLRALARAAMELVSEYETDRSDSLSDNVNAALKDIEEAGLLRFLTVVDIGRGA